MAASRLGRRTTIIAGAVVVVACLAALGSVLYLRYVDVARFSAEHGRITVEAAPAGPLGTVLVTNKGFALYLFGPDAARRGCVDRDPPVLGAEPRDIDVPQVQDGPERRQARHHHYRAGNDRGSPAEPRGGHCALPFRRWSRWCPSPPAPTSPG